MRNKNNLKLRVFKMSRETENHCSAVARDALIESTRQIKRGKRKKLQLLYPLNLYADIFLYNDIKSFVKFILPGNTGLKNICDLYNTFQIIVPTVLSEEETKIISLRYKSQKTLKATATEVGIRLDTARYKVEQALRKLRNGHFLNLIEVGIDSGYKISREYSELYNKYINRKFGDIRY